MVGKWLKAVVEPQEVTELSQRLLRFRYRRGIQKWLLISKAASRMKMIRREKDRERRCQEQKKNSTMRVPLTKSL
jgi:hypothetical protein